MIDLLYFAWIRERIGLPREEYETEAATVAELIEELRQKEDRYALAFSDLKSVRVAVDQTLVNFDTTIKDAREVAFFPPMTGG